MPFVGEMTGMGARGKGRKPLESHGIADGGRDDDVGGGKHIGDF
mgnify:FL=1